MPGYLDEIKQLPLPTVGQTDNYAAHVVWAHSWYKHLPLFPPGQRFVFYLHPKAGWVVTIDSDVFQHLHLIAGVEPKATYDGGKRRRWEPLTQEEADRYGLHYSEMPTPTYLERFGHWRYSRMSPDLRALSIYSSSLEPVELPADVIAQCGCLLTAFVHPWHQMFARFLWDSVYYEEKRRAQADSALDYAEKNPHDAELQRYAPLLDLVRKGRTFQREQLNAYPQLPEVERLSRDFWSITAEFAVREEEVLQQRVRDTLQKAREFFADVV